MYTEKRFSYISNPVPGNLSSLRASEMVSIIGLLNQDIKNFIKWGKRLPELQPLFIQYLQVIVLTIPGFTFTRL
ncbi:hypothetical protein A3860_34775 [Niastella vici]|uniref:Uncharacterized protein n=1 Tax=Niastella vici TaxID=1703345 RepID=A0A1V9FPA2_9BACT|nr:hypothetical protein A3860_34775 [Niastella vici]